MAAALAAVAGAEPPRYTRTLAAYEPPAVSLIDARGEAVALAAELERPGPVLVQFVFTSCATACPVLTGTVAAAAERMPEWRLLSISIDPEVDTPARLAEYAAGFHAGERWRFLTGDPGDLVAVQQAFDAYVGGKMRHQPLTFLRAEPGARWLRLEGFPSAGELAAEAEALLAPARGRRVYREGVLGDGRPLVARVSGDVALEGRAAACATCHRPSGYGGVEGRTWVPPITARWLFEGTQPRRIDLYRHLFQEELAPSSFVRLRSAGERPAYSRDTLAAALVSGHDPAGRGLDPLMPRYTLGERDFDDLAAYLETLSASPPPGVTEREISFATVIAGEVPEARRKAMLEVMAAFVRFKNADTERRAARLPDPLGHEDELPSARRLWTLDVWELGGPPSGWRAQLETRYRERPVFALLGGLGDESWQPIHAFCEQHGVPCLFPETDLPVVEPAGESTFYLSAGLDLEARAVARHLTRDWPALGASRLVQVYREGPRGAVPAAALRRALAGRGIEVRDVAVPAGAALGPPVARALAEGPAVVALWLGAEDLRSFGALAGAAVLRLYTPASTAREPVAAWPASLAEKVFLVDRFAPAAAGADQTASAWTEPPHAARARAWLRARGIAPSAEERLQLSTTFTLSLAEAAVGQMLDFFSRELFVENVEREAERTPNPGVYPRLALGPGQRFASRGCAVTPLAAERRLTASRSPR